jgi:hypothetical protein
MISSVMPNASESNVAAPTPIQIPEVTLLVDVAEVAEQDWTPARLIPRSVTSRRRA